MFKVLFISFLLCSFSYALCTDELNEEDLNFIRNSKLNEVNFKCSINKETYYYNKLSQDEYKQSLYELKLLCPHLSQKQLEALRYALCLNEAIYNLKLENKNFSYLSVFNANKMDISMLEKLRTFYYEQASKDLNFKQQKEFELLFDIADEIYAKSLIVKMPKSIPLDTIKHIQKENEKILEHIQDLCSNFENQGLQAFNIRLINKLVLLYNVNLLFNEGKNLQERKIKAYESNQGLELLKALLNALKQTQNQENQLTLMQGAFITYDKAISSLDIDLPLDEKKFNKIMQRKEYIILITEFMKTNAFGLFNKTIKNLDFKEEFRKNFPQKTSEILTLMLIYNAMQKTLIITKEALDYER